MLHHILVKWNPTVEKQAAVQAVRALYAEATMLSRSGTRAACTRNGKPSLVRVSRKSVSLTARACEKQFLCISICVN